MVKKYKVGDLVENESGHFGIVLEAVEDLPLHHNTYIVVKWSHDDSVEGLDFGFTEDEDEDERSLTEKDWLRIVA